MHVDDGLPPALASELDTEIVPKNDTAEVPEPAIFKVPEVNIEAETEKLRSELESVEAEISKYDKRSKIPSRTHASLEELQSRKSVIAAQLVEMESQLPGHAPSARVKDTIDYSALLEKFIEDEEIVDIIPKIVLQVIRRHAACRNADRELWIAWKKSTSSGSSRSTSMRRGTSSWR
jgi:hypothetical protein